MITRKSILSLNEKADKLNISIYIPTHKSGKEVQEDPIRFKNVIQQIRQKLEELGEDPENIESILEEPNKLLDTSDFWQHSDKGLAVFFNKGHFSYHRLPIELEERFLIDSQFLITPLVRMLTMEGSFCLLALSQKKIRLLKCTSTTSEPIYLEDTPVSLEDFQKYDVNQESIQHHSGQGDGQAIFHGQGGGDDKDGKMVEEYLKTVENEVTRQMRHRNDPLILAGMEKPMAHYRKVNHFDRTMDQGIRKNPDGMSDKELQEQGWEIIKDYFLKDMYEDIERLGNISETDKMSDDLKSVLEGAHFGKVDTLFIPVDEARWGYFDPEKRIVQQTGQKNNSEIDLINLAAIKTLDNGGDVYALTQSDMPLDKEIAAIFRYA